MEATQDNKNVLEAGRLPSQIKGRGPRWASATTGGNTNLKGALKNSVVQTEGTVEP